MITFDSPRPKEHTPPEPLARGAETFIRLMAALILLLVAASVVLKVSGR